MYLLNILCRNVGEIEEGELVCVFVCVFVCVCLCVFVCVWVCVCSCLQFLLPNSSEQPLHTIQLWHLLWRRERKEMNKLLWKLSRERERDIVCVCVCVFVKEGKCECVWSTVKHSLDWRTHGVSISFKAGQNLFEFIIFPNKNCSNSLFFRTKFVRIYHFFEQNLEQIIFLNFFWKYSPSPNKQFLKQ